MKRYYLNIKKTALKRAVFFPYWVYFVYYKDPADSIKRAAASPSILNKFPH
jgi:hypothetical protein